MTMRAIDGLPTDRIRLPGGWAPGGLCLVQELVNTSIRAPQPSPGWLTC